MPHVEVMTWRQACELREAAEKAATVEELKVILLTVIDQLAADIPVRDEEVD